MIPASPPPIKGSNPDTERAEPDSKAVELLQTLRVQGVALPGMRAKGWSLDAKLEVTPWGGGRGGGEPH